MTMRAPENLRDVFSWRYLFHPSTILIFLANLVPLYGVLFWHWDAFLLLMLYWMETAVIGFWMILTIAIQPAGSFPPIYVGNRPTYGRFPRVAFFLVHAGMFMGGHFLFLWLIFSGAWANKVHGVAGFIDQIVLKTGLWVPLAALFIARGLSFLFHDLCPDLLPRLLRTVSVRRVRIDAAPREPTDMLLGFYGRTIIMQFVIIFGAVLSLALGSMAPFVLLILIKTAVDVLAHLVIDIRTGAGGGGKPGSQPAAS